MRYLSRAAFLLCTVIFQQWTSAATPVPDPLKPWQEWVLQDEKHLLCPYLLNQDPGDKAARRCAWPGALVLNLSNNGGEFRQDWQVFTETWVTLPGNVEYWPRDVRLDGGAAPVVLREERPQLLLPAGAHRITGRFGWSDRPESLRISARTAMVELTLDGRKVTQPERPEGNVWLGQRQAAVERDQLQIQVYRLLTDDIPARLVTRLRLQVSGAGREELLAAALPAGFNPLRLESNLPARLDPDGRLRVQLRPGSFELELQARATNVAAGVTRPAGAGTWPVDEIWSFQGVDRLRVAVAEGPPSIDPSQADVPDEWREFPAFRMGAATTMNVVERSRALANLDDNRIELHRELWLDFDHRGYTFVDTLEGSMHRDWRLDMRKPYELQSARSGAENLLITEGAEGNSGVELRIPSLELEALGRIEGSRRSVSATGWKARFEAVSGTLHLPPGHRLLGARGADTVQGSWFSNWGLWNLFGVLVVAVLTFWVVGRNAAIIAAVALLLMYQEAPAMIWYWANALAAIAVLRVAAGGRGLRLLAAYRTVSFILLALYLIPVCLGQLHAGLYPQLEPFQWGATGRGLAMNIVTNIAEPSESRALKLDMPRPNAPPPAAVDMEEVQVTGSLIRSAGVSQRYAEGTLVQAGPGIPDWQYNDYGYGWSGPVDESQKVQFIFIGPALLGAWRFAGVILLALLGVMLAGSSWRFTLNLPRSGRPATASALLLVIAGMGLLVASPAVQAQAMPSPELLRDLRLRLTATSPCASTCAELLNAQVDADGESLDARLLFSALTPVAVPLPHAADRWQIDAVTVDGRAALAVGREPDASLWLPLASGTHEVRIVGRLANTDSLQLNFPQSPRVIAVSSRGWDAGGFRNGRLLAGSLDLVRRRALNSAGPAATLAASEFPAFVRVTRAIRLDLDWKVDTRVERIAPAAAPLQVEIPILAGESVLTPGVQVQQGRVQIGIGRGQEQSEWNSSLARSDAINLSMPEAVPRAEVWTFAVSPQWHLEFTGFPPALPPQPQAGPWVYHYYPRPGETLSVRVSRPVAVKGGTLAIDTVNHSSVFGKRSVNGELLLNYRSTQGSRHTVSLPESLRVTEVTADGEPVPIRPEKGALPLSLLAGEHQIQIKWTDSRGASLLTRPARIDLGAAASNVHTSIELPNDRWVLIANGRGVGPAIVYWGELLIFVLVAAVLGQLSISPLRPGEWLLLGLGLSTLSWKVFAVVSVWLLLLRWRERWNHHHVRRFWFNGVQVGLVFVSVIAVISLVFSGVRYGLLSTPGMGVEGPQSYSGHLEWFADRAESVLDLPGVISVPMWVYKAMMFAWALWVALALVRWLKLGWNAWSTGGMWRARVAVREMPPST